MRNGLSLDGWEDWTTVVEFIVSSTLLRMEEDRYAQTMPLPASSLNDIETGHDLQQPAFGDLEFRISPLIAVAPVCIRRCLYQNFRASIGLGEKAVTKLAWKLHLCFCPGP